MQPNATNRRKDHDATRSVVALTGVPNSRAHRHNDMTPQKKYSRNSKKSSLVQLAPITTPSLDNNVKPSVSAKARWADLKGRVSQRSAVKTNLRRQQLQNLDFWDRAAANERIKGQLDSRDDDESSSDDSDDDKETIKVWVHVHDQSYPEELSDHITKFRLNPPSLTFPFSLGKARQDFRWLSISAMRRFTSVYRPQGRIRHREWFVGPGDINLRAKQVYLDTQQSKKKRDIDGAELAASLILEHATPQQSTHVSENTPLHQCLKDGDHVWIHFQNGKPTALLAGGSSDDMRTVEVFRRTRMHDGMVIAPPPAKEKKTMAVVKKTFKLEESVFARRASQSDSGSFYDTDEYYSKVCSADLAYCSRLAALVGEPGEYERVSALLKDNYRFIREAFRFHVAQSR